MDLRENTYLYTCLYVWHAGMMDNGGYMHRGYMHSYHFIYVVVTLMIYAM